MDNKTRRLFFRILILAVVSAAVTALGLLTLRGAGWDGQTLSSLVNSETVIVMMVLAALIPVGLLALLLSVVFVSRPLLKFRRPRRKPRFPALRRIDAQAAKQPAPKYVRCSLQEICTLFRGFAANRLGLYYEIDDIRRFIAGMGVSRLIILRGISGTGKTSLAYAAGEFFGNPSAIVPVQPMWKERADMLGYFNEFTGRFHETPLLCKLYEAGTRDDVFVTVLDEMNISRIEYYFAEFLSLLEVPDPNRRLLDVVSDSWITDPKRLKDGKLLLPQNMWFIGTANNDDSTFAISDKVYDRAMVLDLDRKCAPFSAQDKGPVHISYTELQRLFAEAKKNHQLSKDTRSRLEALDKYLGQVFRIGFGNRILHQLECYVPIMLACGGTELGALDDILSRKILRKLEQLSPTLLKNELPRLRSWLQQAFGPNSLPQCQEYLGRLERYV